MWDVKVFSLGDLYSDRYLLEDPDLFSDSVSPHFEDIDAVCYRLEVVEDSIRRLMYERAVLKKYGTSLVGAVSWLSILDGQNLDSDVMDSSGHLFLSSF